MLPRRLLYGLVALTALCLPAAVSAGASRPAVRVVEAAPLTVDGTGFERLERVRITLEIGADRTVRRLRANRAGRFRAGFAHAAVDRCNEDLVVIATGSKGSRAQAKLPMLQCPPAL